MTASTPHSPAEQLETEALRAGEAAAGGLRAIEVAGIVLLGLLLCPPLAILVVIVAVPLLVIGLVLALLAAILTLPYLLVQGFRGHHGDHRALLAQRLRHAGRALFDLAPHRIVADVRKASARS